MANQTAPSNRGIVEAAALMLAFSLVKSSPLVPTTYAGKSGTATYSSIRSRVREEQPTLAGDALTKRVNDIRNELDASALAGVLKLHKEGFHFTRFNGRELKNGSRNVSVGMSNAIDKGATPVRKLADMSSTELRELAAIRETAEKAAKTPVIEA